MFIVKICRRPVRRLAKTSFVPVGDHAGEVSCPVVVVIWCRLVPSSFMTKMLELPPTLRWKTTCAPSGENDG